MFTKLISFVIGLSLVAGLCSLDVGWEIVVQTHAETGVSLNKLSSSITAFINIIGIGFQTTFPVKYILEARSDYCSSPEQTGRGFAFTLAKSTRIFCGPFERYVRDKRDCNTRPLLTKRWSPPLSVSMYEFHWFVFLLFEPINFSETGDEFVQLVNTLHLTDELPIAQNRS